MSSKKEQQTAFQRAVKFAEHLEWRPGFTAIKRGEGKDRITAKDTLRVLGSAAMDDDCNVPPHQSSPRWDYAVGYGRATEPTVYYIEVHSADTRGVGEVEKKLSVNLRKLGLQGPTEHLELA